MDSLTIIWPSGKIEKLTKNELKEKYEKAIFKLIQAISRNNMEAKYYFLLGHSYYNLNKPDFACADWSVANSLDSTILKKEIKALCNLK